MKEIEFDVAAIKKSESQWQKKSDMTTRVPTVRTFRNDVEEQLKEHALSRASIAIAEAARRETRGESRFPINEDVHLGKMIFVLILVFAFGIGVGGYALIGSHFSFSSLLGSATSTFTHEFSANNTRIALTNSPRAQVLADILIAFKKTSLSVNETLSLVFTSTSKDRGVRAATVSEFFVATQADQVPNTLITSLEENFSYHIFSSSTLTGVLSFNSRSYANTFATMLDWEPSMATTLVPIVNPLYGNTQVKNLIGRGFKDKRIGKYDVRVLYDLDGVPTLAYTFINKKTLVIAGGSEALGALPEKLGLTQK